MKYTIVCYDKPNRAILLRCKCDEIYTSLESVNIDKKYAIIKEIVKNLFLAVNRLYEKGEFHGCLVPSNILVKTEDNSVIIKNYCLYMIEGNDRLYGMKNTEFICPEIRNGEKLSKKSDMWCIGKIIQHFIPDGTTIDKVEVIENKDKTLLQAIKLKCLKEDVNERMSVELLEGCFRNEEYYYYIINESDSYESIINDFVKDEEKFNKLIEGVLISLDDEKKISKWKEKFCESKWFSWLGGVIEDSTNYYILLKSARHAQLNCFVRTFPFTEFGTSEMAKYSKYLINLEVFKCRSNEIGDEGLINLCKCFTNTKKLRCLDVSDNGIGDRGINTLVSNFDYIPNITMLILDGCKMKAETVMNFCCELPKLKNLEVLSLNNQKLGNEDVKQLNQNLNKLAKLSNLSLVSCGLKNNVVELKLSFSKLKKSERKDTPRVDLDSNEIDDKSFIEIYDYLMKNNRKDINMCLNYNLLTKQIFRTIKKYKKTITGKLYLLSNSFTYDEYLQVDKEVRKIVDIETSFK